MQKTGLGVKTRGKSDWMRERSGREFEKERRREEVKKREKECVRKLTKFRGRERGDGVDEVIRSD